MWLGSRPLIADVLFGAACAVEAGRVGGEKVPLEETE
jgi:hypothetical protein